MSEQPQSIQPPDEPLDPYTLRVVIERLGERITHAETERENDASEGLPADEMADWDTRIEALELARWDIENIAKTANPRARVVVLPKPPVRAPRRYAKIAEAAEYLGVTDRTIRQMIADGRLTGYRSGTRLVRVDLDEIDAAMQPFGGGA